MASEIPHGDTAVYAFLEIVAFCFALAGVDALVAGKSWRAYVPLLLAAVFFFLAGIKWTWIKGRTVALLRWLRTSKALEAALADNAALRSQIVGLMDKLKALESSRDPEEAKEVALRTHRTLSERVQKENLFLKSKVTSLESQLADIQKRPEPQLIIHSAKYGPIDGFEDVTACVQAMVRNNRLEVSITDGTFQMYFADPDKLAARRLMSLGVWLLKVEYSYGAYKHKEVARSQFENLQLPEEADRN